MPVPLKQHAPVTATLHSTCSLLPPAVKHCKALLSDASLLLVLHDNQYSVLLTSQVLVLTSGFPGLFLTTVPGASPARSLSLGLQLGQSPSADVTTDYPLPSPGPQVITAHQWIQVMPSANQFSHMVISHKRDGFPLSVACTGPFSANSRVLHSTRTPSQSAR